MVNEQTIRIRRIFRWCSSEQMIPADVCTGLQTVDGLRHGHSDAHETEPVKPVPEHHVDAIEAHVSPTIWAAIQVQRLTGMRSGEVCIIRSRDIDMTGDVWLYRPSSHKTEHHGHERAVEFGPRAQGIIRTFLTNRATSDYLFSPTEAEVERSAEKRRQRKTRVPPSQKNRSKRRPMRRPRERYDSTSYRRAICRACDSACPPPSDITGDEVASWRTEHRWHPHQLRHSFATRIRREFGIEAARILCGHRSVAVTETYAEIDRNKVTGIVARFG